MHRPNHAEAFIVSVEYSREDKWTEVLNKDVRNRLRTIST